MRTCPGVLVARWQLVLPKASACIPAIACIGGVTGMTDSADVVALARRCAHLTPRIERHPHALVLDLTGCERLVLAATATAATSTAATPTDHDHPFVEQIERGDLHALVAAALYRITRNPLGCAPSPVRVGVASTRTLAWLAATSPIITHESSLESEAMRWRTLTATQLAPFPLTTLKSLPDLVDSREAATALDVLDQSGIRTLGQLARLSPIALRRRFGTVGAALALLAVGHDLAPLRIAASERWLSGRMCFHAPIPAERIPRTFIALARRLADILSQRQLAAGAVGLVLQPEIGRALHLQRRLSQPITSPAALVDHAQRLLAQLTHEDRGGAESHMTYQAVQLRTGGLRTVAPHQPCLWPGLWPDRQTQQAHRARLLAAVCSRPPRDEHASHAGLLRAALATPNAVLPEDRYALRPMSVPVTEEGP